MRVTQLLNDAISAPSKRKFKRFDYISKIGKKKSYIFCQSARDINKEKMLKA